MTTVKENVRSRIFAKSSLRICLFGDATNVHLIRWAEALRARGIDLFIITYREAKLPDFQLYDISCSEMRGNADYERFLRFFRGIKMFFLLRRSIRKIQPDIVHVHYLVNTPLVFAFWGFRRLVVSPWGNDIIFDRGKEPWSVIIYKKVLLRWARQVTATTMFLGKHIRQYAKVNPTIIPFGVDTKKFSGKAHSSRKEIALTFVKHLEEKYGARYLIKAVPLILKECAELRVNIVGRGALEQELRDLVNQKGLQNHIYFHGKFNHDQVVGILRHSDIFVMPSIYESEIFGVAAIEASSMMLPVVATDFPGIREAVVDCETGILIPPANSRAIADACIKLIKHPALMRQMGKKGRRYVKANFEWKDCVDRMLAVYRKVL